VEFFPPQAAPARYAAWSRHLYFWKKREKNAVLGLQSFVAFGSCRYRVIMVQLIWS